MFWEIESVRRSKRVHLAWKNTTNTLCKVDQDGHHRSWRTPPETLLGAVPCQICSVLLLRFGQGKAWQGSPRKTSNEQGNFGLVHFCGDSVGEQEGSPVQGTLL